MRVIVIKPIGKFNKIGEAIELKGGYVRNFLLPRRFVLNATSENQDRFEKSKQELEIKYQDQKQKALGALEIVTDKILTFISQALEDGKLFGSINIKQIIKQLSNDYQLELKPEQVFLKENIKRIGMHKVELVLHHEVRADIFVNVARTESEALKQLNAFKTSITEQQVIPTTEATGIPQASL